MTDSKDIPGLIKQAIQECPWPYTFVAMDLGAEIARADKYALSIATKVATALRPADPKAEHKGGMLDRISMRDWQMVAQAGFLTDGEKRRILGVDVLMGERLP